MLKNLSYKLTSYIKNNSDIKNTEDLEKINYSFQVILNECFKIIVLTILFLILGRIQYLLFSMAVLLSIRIFSGGYHADTTTKCLLWTTLFFLTTSLAAPMFPRLSILTYKAVSLLSIIIVFFKSPYPNTKRPVKDKKRRWYLKFISIFHMFLWIVILLFFIDNTAYLNCGFMTILLQILQLIIPIRKES
ncbi:accessory gene regulator B family protein [Clostridium sp. A1-XYC3]|uniref:Accessory gene regulator B family protein n=1 Tax=Clostridium tanneri TaxID=3037988 RepID=A0ABU4JRD4_9CLOT|nr:accessory gene regulator B family protein [Clostridium sp. A1-XYC3]MDW8800707.1 accessory gene regulator B family protein [Clostridium sp. A1-XYC3]